MKIHALMTFILLVLLRIVAYGPGPFGGCCAVSRVAGMLLAFSFFLFFVVLLAGGIVWRKRRICHATRRGRVFFEFAVIVVLDAALLFEIFTLLGHCLLNEGKREFWGEGRALDIDGETILPACYALDAMKKLREGKSIGSDFETPVLTSSPHFCLGAANLGEPGSLRVRIVDPTNGSILGESRQISARWSDNQMEKFAYVVRCPFFKGRQSEYYRVRCEVWGILERTGEDRLIASNDVITNGVY